MKKLFLATALLALTACSDADTAKRILSEQGMTDITTTGYDLWGCGEDDWYSTGFRAKSPHGIPVSGVVCSGWFKGGTVRYY